MSPNVGNTSIASGEYHDAIIKACTKWGVPVLDLSKDVPPFGLFSATHTMQDVVDAYTADTTGTGHGDGWHPNEAGYRKYYVPKIEAWMKTL